MFKKVVADLLSQYKEIEIPKDLIEIPQDRELGDFALPCFQFAKELKKSPIQIAQDIASSLLPNDYISEVKVTGPYINFSLNNEFVLRSVVSNIIEKWDNYGRWDTTWKTLLIEWWSPNTHKMLHVGHLRNALVSETLCTITEYAWNKVIRTAYWWDIGAHVAKRLRYFTKFTDQTFPTDPRDFWIWSGELYQASTRKIDEDPETFKQEVHDTQKLLEDGDKTLNDLWKKTREISIQWLVNSFSELWCSIERFYRESEVEQPGIELVKKYEQDESIPDIRMSEGAIISDLEKEDLGIFLLLKSNWTSLYSTKDIALAYLKESEYDFDTSLYVVATEQNHHFNQLFKTLDKVGYNTSKLHHVGYELVELPDGKMSSRKWTIIPYHVRRKEAIEKAKALIAERDIENKDELAHQIAFAALKFSMLLQDTYKKIRIDVNNSISFDGETWPYLQYSFARACSVLRKAGVEEWNKESKLAKLTLDEERLLALRLSEFSDIVLKASQEYKPSLIARYVLELARDFNAYYQSTKFIVEEDPELTKDRLTLVYAIKQVLKNGLSLLWIDAPERM